MKTHKIYVYGTLRPFNSPTVEVAGELFDLGWYPGARLGGSSTFKAEVIEVDDEKLQDLDDYEGFSPNSPENSLYLREKYEDGWIYVYNQDLTDRRPIESGDWAEYVKTKEGRY